MGVLGIWWEEFGKDWEGKNQSRLLNDVDGESDEESILSKDMVGIMGKV